MHSLLSCALLALGLQATSVAAKSVFAHYIVGTTSEYSQDDWATSIQQAAAAGVDGFALNIGTDSYTNTQLDNAFNAADAHGGFTLFLSFDYGASQWSADAVTSTLNSYISRGSYFKYNGKPVASTFEGTSNAGDWGAIKSATGASFMPDFSSLGASGAASAANVDGLLSWEAWPIGTDDTPTADQGYISALGGRPYIMPVSPWFYTNLPSKNWLWKGNSLWHKRWQQVNQFNPEMVEILTWNDWGESHYIAPNPPHANALPSGSETYVNEVVHNAWINDLPYYISTYKNGSPPSDFTEHITFWYRLNPGASCSDGGTTCNNPSYGQQSLSPSQCDTDEIMFTVFSKSKATVTVEIGGNAQTVTADAAGAFHSTVSFNGQTGNVTISAKLDDGSTLGPVQGPAITTDCGNYGGKTNWNPWVGGS